MLKPNSSASHRDQFDCPVVNQLPLNYLKRVYGALGGHVCVLYLFTGGLHLLKVIHPHGIPPPYFDAPDH